MYIDLAHTSAHLPNYVCTWSILDNINLPGLACSTYKVSSTGADRLQSLVRSDPSCMHVSNVPIVH